MADSKRPTVGKREAPNGLGERDLDEELCSFLRHYGSADTVQEAEAADTDQQIKNLSLPIALLVGASPAGTVLDIGCGSGILLRRLSTLEPFRDNRAWIYAASDFDERLEGVLTLAAELRLHRRVEVLSLEQLYTSWISPDVAPTPRLVVLRNVLHELDIEATARLFSTLAAKLEARDTLLVQDLQLLPKAERGNVCWHPGILGELFRESGFTSTGVTEPSKSGNRWFTFQVRRTDAEPLSPHATLQLVIAKRRQQFELWNRLGAIMPAGADTRFPKIGILDFDLQRAALIEQLRNVDAPGIPAPTPADEAKVASAAFAMYLDAFQTTEVRKSRTPLELVPNFRDRAHSQDSLEEFFRGNDPVVVITGGAFMGKSALVSQVLSRRAHDRQPLVIDPQSTSSVWNLIEQLLTGIGCTFSCDIMRGFRAIQFAYIKPSLTEFLRRSASRLLVVFDHFERLLDPDRVVSDTEIQDFVKVLACAAGAKLVITARVKPDLAFLSVDVSVNDCQPPVNRFPEGKHIENVLDDFNCRPALGVDSYPEALLEAIDRHPYLAVLAARIVNKERATALRDSTFLDLLRQEMRTELLRRVVDDVAKPAAELLSLVRIPIPRSMFEGLIGREAVRHAEELGLVYQVSDLRFEHLLTGIGVLRRRIEDNEDDTGAFDTHTDEAAAADRMHRSISAWYTRLYREHGDPRWLREMHYHTLACGDPSLIDRFGVVYKAELFWAGNVWFHDRKDYRAALTAFLAARRFGLDRYECDMRIAACLMRVGRRLEGEEGYKSLIVRYPGSRGAKTSYIDSLLYLRDFGSALQRLEEYRFRVADSAWVAHEFGRTYLGLHRYREAVQAFEMQRRMKPEPIAYFMLAHAYHRAGDRDDVGRVLESGLKRFRGNRRLSIAYAAHLIRLGQTEAMIQAQGILDEVLNLRHYDGAALQQLVKVLCLLGRLDEAETVVRSQKEKAYPERYRVPICVEVLIARGRFENAVSEIGAVRPDDMYLVGLKKKVFLCWARSEEEVEARRAIGKRGLAVPMDDSLTHNIPIMVTCAKLAAFAEDSVKYDEYMARIEELNPDVAELLLSESPSMDYWDDDSFEH